MPKTRAKKEELAQELSSDLERMQIAVLTDYQGLTVREIQDLRGQLREQGMNFRVVKNTLLKRATDGAGVKMDQVTGPLGVAFGYEDPVTAAKIVNKFTKDHAALEIVGGIYEEKTVDAEMIKRLAALPDREELLGRLIGSIGGPARNLAAGLSAISRNLVYALRAVKEQKA